MKLLGQSVVAGLALAVASVAAAQATPLTGTFSITAYQGTNSGNQESAAIEQANEANPLLSSTALGTITYTGALNFVDNSGPDTIGAFLTSAGGTITGSTSFFGDTLSTAPFALTTLLVITGSNSHSLSGSISHDDGVTLYDSTNTAVASSASPTTDVPTSYSINAGAFKLIYVEANGLPADLDFDVTSVPEPASIALLGAGLVGIGAIRRRRGAKAA